MIIRALDANNDWQFGRGVGSYATNEQAIEENIRTRLLSWVGDCFFALQDWIDWKARLDKGQQANLESELRSNILQAYGVVGVNSLTATLNPVSRGLTIQYDIQTIYSPSFLSTVEQAAGAVIT